MAGLLVLVILIALTIPITVRSDKDGTRAEAISNIKQVGMAMYSFSQDYGKYPDASTIEAVHKKTGTLLNLGTKTSNDYFRQLIAAGCIDSETSFHTNIKGSRRSDRQIDGIHALEKGECGFAYIVGLNPEGQPEHPLLVTPLIPGTDRFDTIPFKGKAIIFWTDNSAWVTPIDNNGHAIDMNAWPGFMRSRVTPIDNNGHAVDATGRNLLDPSNPLWHGQPPVIAWPE